MRLAPALLAVLLIAGAAHAQDRPPLGLMDVFELEYASDPQISPDGETVVYRRNRLDVQTDRVRGDLWAVQADGSDHRPLAVGVDAAGARWSPDGTRLAYVARDEADDDRRHLMVRYLESGVTVPVARLASAPGGLAWSPDGTQIALTRFVETDAESFASLPGPPDGAEWADAPRVIERTIYRQDGQGYVKPGARQLFVVPAEGGTPRALTDGPHDIDGTPAWTPDGRALIVASDQRDDADLDPGDSELYRVDVATGRMTVLTDRRGPDAAPAVSPDGRTLAYLGADDRRLGYQLTNLYTRALDGGTARQLLPDLDRDLQNPTWAGDRLVVSYDDQGSTHLAVVDNGRLRALADDLGGMSIGRPYPGSAFSVGGGRVAFTFTHPSHPADIAVVDLDGSDRRTLTRLNADLLAQRTVGAVEEVWAESSADGRRIQGWIVTPPGFDAARQYPLILEIHGGPFQNYGPRFSMEAQLFAAAGYVVLYTNPRGSTSYGEDFGNLIHHAYPSQDYDDLMSSVDAVVARGFIDPDRLYVTGGSGGGVLTAWIVGHTDRFAASVVAKPVINWTSWLLTADMYPFGAKYWFDALPWEDPEGYWARSPLAYVGNVTTPTMVLTGEDDVRTPMSESEQYYQALRLEGVPSALVRIPGAAHGIAARPSGLMRKVGHILAWFERYGGPALASN